MKQGKQNLPNPEIENNIRNTRTHPKNSTFMNATLAIEQ
jgi:hypothetical protein